jgi:hypothetical protein
MNINTTRALLWVMDAALVAGAGYVVVEVEKAKDADKKAYLNFMAKLDSDLATMNVPPTKGPARLGVESFGTVSLSNEAEKTAVEAPAAPVAPVATYEPLENLMKVVSIQWSSAPDDSKVALFPKSAKDQPNEQVIFGVNDLVFFAKGAVVKEIRPREVVFKYGPTEKDEQTLKIATEPPRDASASMPSPTGNVKPIGSLEAGIVYKPDSGVIVVNPQGRVALEKEGERILEGVTYGTTDLGGGKKGLKIETIPPGNELGKYGVESGDVLISVNSVPMSSKSEVVDYVKRNSKLGRYDVRIMRRGAYLNKTITVAQ